jgi:F-type H+-transporting ATPase subunit epsilon
MATTFAFQLITPTGVVFDGRVEQVTATGPLGQFGVLADHTNLITSLAPGVITIRGGDGQTREYLVTGGLVEVKDGAMTALTPNALPPEKTEPADEAELRAAEERLAQMSMYDPSYAEAEETVAVMRVRRDIAQSRGQAPR